MRPYLYKHAYFPSVSEQKLGHEIAKIQPTLVYVIPLCYPYVIPGINTRNDQLGYSRFMRKAIQVVYYTLNVQHVTTELLVGY